ncbi:hypothetical protein [Streptomyces lydicus]|uniref:hypothetical protein n=1 Tax=Streptomyces lydicus TaxID=47763 RepID=UPI0037AB5F73
MGSLDCVSGAPSASYATFSAIALPLSGAVPGNVTKWEPDGKGALRLDVVQVGTSLGSIEPADAWLPSAFDAMTPISARQQPTGAVAQRISFSLVLSPVQ